MKRSTFASFPRLACALAVCLGVSLAASAAPVRGTISSYYEEDLTSWQLNQYVDSFIPPSAQRLGVFTQCYGGNSAADFTGSNWSIISATSVGEKAKYGGYDNDAADALKPGAGRTAQDVHNAGTAGKHPAETPSTGGGLAPGSFSLEPVTATGPVRSRHILVYAGEPDDKGRDNAMRDKIKANFAGQSNTTVTTVGGKGLPGYKGVDGWDHYSSPDSLRRALKKIGQDIANAPDPSKEQFILFVTDHGGLAKATPAAAVVTPNGKAAVPAVEGLASAELTTADLVAPGVSLFVPFDGVTPFDMGEDPELYSPYFAPGQWELEIDPDGPGPEAPFMLVDFVEKPLEFDNRILGDEIGEGMSLFFPVDRPLFETFLIDSFFDVEISNNTLLPWMINEVVAESGMVPKVPSVDGDANDDDLVDMVDYGVWFENYGTGTVWEEGNFKGEDFTDMTDYAAWFANYGTGGQAVPEPASMALLLFASTALLGGRRSSRLR